MYALARIAVFLIICQAASTVFTAQLYRPRWPGCRQILPAAIAAAAAGLLGLLPPYIYLWTLPAAGLWAAAAAVLLYAGRAAAAALLGWGLCLVAAPLTVAIGGLPGSSGSALGEMFAMLLWVAMTGLLLGVALGLIQLLERRKADWPRLLIFLSCCLEFAAVGFFARRILESRSPQTLAALIVALLLGMSYIALVFMFRHVLRNDAKWQHRNDLIRAELKMQEQQFAASAGVLARARRMRHDFGNHAEVARSLLEAGQKEEAEQYLSKVRRAWEQADDSNVELNDFGRLTADLAAICAQHGVAFRVGGTVPDETGPETPTVLALLRDVTGWAVNRLQGTADGSVSLDLQARECFECQMGPYGEPSSADQQALRKLCPGTTVEFETDGPWLLVQVSGWKEDIRFRDRPQRSAAP